MKISVVLGKSSYLQDRTYLEMTASLKSSGHSLEICSEDGPAPDSDMLMSVGGDGTFLKSAAAASSRNLPVLGVNLGHLGFLSENTPEDVADALSTGNFHIQERAMLKADVGNEKMLALNEICVSRIESSMLGIQVGIDGNTLPVCWADGLLVSTPSGSTAYSLSVGGPIVLPQSKVLVIAPVAPHNLNVRPMIVPLESSITLKFISRSDSVRLSADNRDFIVPSSAEVNIGMAQFSLKRVCLDNSNFIKALSEKLFWGEDKRNGNDR